VLDALPASSTGKILKHRLAAAAAAAGKQDQAVPTA
jgi:hypothetical protein